MITGIGVDIVKIERFAGKNHSRRFMWRIFTPQEQEYLKNKGVQSMAGLFSAKEAVAKALGTGFKGFWPRDIEIIHDDFGRPQVVLHGAARTASVLSQICVSISHNDTDAVAFAVISCEGLGGV